MNKRRISPQSESENDLPPTAKKPRHNGKESSSHVATQSAAMNTLPNELLLHIFQFVPRSYLFICGRVCHNWRELTTTALPERSNLLKRKNANTLVRRWLRDGNAHLVLWLLENASWSMERSGVLIRFANQCLEWSASLSTASKTLALSDGLAILLSEKSLAVPSISLQTLASLSQCRDLTLEQFQKALLLVSPRRLFHNTEGVCMLLRVLCARHSNPEDFLLALEEDKLRRPILMYNLSPELLSASLCSHETYTTPASHPSFESSLFVWLRTVGCPWNSSVLHRALRAGAINAYEYMMVHMFPPPAVFDRDTPLSHEHNTCLLKEALSAYSLKPLRFLLSRHSLLLPLSDPTFVDDVIKIKRLNRGVVTWMIMNSCAITSNLLLFICSINVPQSALSELVARYQRDPTLFAHLDEPQRLWKGCVEQLLWSSTGEAPLFRSTFEKLFNMDARHHLDGKILFSFLKNGAFRLIGWALDIGVPLEAGRDADQLLLNLLILTICEPEDDIIQAIEDISRHVPNLRVKKGCMYSCIHMKESTKVLRKILSMAQNGHHYQVLIRRAARDVSFANAHLPCIEWLHENVGLPIDDAHMLIAIGSNACDVVGWLAKQGVKVPPPSDWNAHHADGPASLEMIRTLAIHHQQTPQWEEQEDDQGFPAISLAGWDSEQWIAQSFLPRIQLGHDKNTVLNNVFKAALQNPNMHICPNVLAFGRCTGKECQKLYNW